MVVDVAAVEKARRGDKDSFAEVYRQIADDLFKQNQCGKQNKRIDTDFCEQLILLISAASEIIKPSHTDTSNQ